MDKSQIRKARNSLNYILPILKKYNFKWCISGGFACFLYGVDRPIHAIDIDIEIDKDDNKFKAFVEEVKPYTTLQFQLWIDKRYDNWVMDVVPKNGVLLSICPTSHLKLFCIKTKKYELFYPNGIPKSVHISFEGFELPTSPKELVLRMKEALSYKKANDRVDIRGMKKLLGNT